MWALYDDVVGEHVLDPFFVRPNSGRKPFSGMTFDADLRVLWLAQMKMIERAMMHRDDMLIVSSLKTILEEYRFVIIDRQAVAGSMYMKDDTMKLGPCDYPDAWALAKYVAELPCQLYSAYVIDIARTPLGCKVIECNAFSTADWYACDLNQILKSAMQLFPT